MMGAASGALRQHDRIAKDWATWISLCIRLRSHRAMHSGTRRRCHARWFAEYTGRVLLDVHSHGAFGRAAHAQRRHPFHMTYYGNQMVVKNYNIMGRCHGRA
jgi:hypothetical protein